MTFTVLPFFEKNVEVDVRLFNRVYLEFLPNLVLFLDDILKVNL